MSKWKTLEHKGPLFPKAYERIGFDENLSNLAEEMLYHYSAKLETDYISNTTFNRNFWKALKPELPKDYQVRKFPDDFLPLCKTIFDYIQKKKEEHKLQSKEQKLQEAQTKEQLKEAYGWAILNGTKQPIASPYIEGPGILICRGKHPALGCWKYRTLPEDVVVNSSIPVKAPEGHSWKACFPNTDSTELCSYKVRVSNGSTLNKRILFSAESVVKQSSDQKKFEKAIKLIQHWDEIKNHIEKNIATIDKKRKQTALVSWLIMNLGIRVGDEKGEDSSDTVGASSLRWEHTTIENGSLKLDFLGKDSVRYTNTVNVVPFIATQFQKLLNEHKKGESLFPFVSSTDVKAFLSEVLDGLSAKVFRTAWGSSLLAEGLQNVQIKPNMTITEKVALVNNAQLLVAKKLNHQRNVGKNYNEKCKELEEVYKKMKVEYINLQESTNNQVEALKQKIEALKEKDFNERDKAVLRKSYKTKIRTLQEKLDVKKQRLHDFKLKLEIKDKTKNLALSTSRTNYCDPRIGISFCKTVDIPIEKIYSKAMQKKFDWAIKCETDFYEKYPLVKI
jgi:DNA topoisomerase-1